MATEAIEGLHEVDGTNLIDYYFRNVQYIQQVDASNITSILAGKGAEAIQALRNALIEVILDIYPGYGTRTVTKPTIIESICQDIHTLTHCYLQNTDYGLGNIFLS